MRSITIQRVFFASVLGTALVTSGCSYREYKEVPTPTSSNTTVVVPQTAAPSAGPMHTYTMVDSAGYRYGTVELDRAGSGRLFDNDGHLIGDVVLPAR